MNKDCSVTTHMCRLSFCVLLLEVSDDTFSVKITNHELPEIGIDEAIERAMTPQDAADLIYFVFHRDRLGPDLSALFFEWKETRELLCVYQRIQDIDHVSYARLIQHLYMSSQRYRELIISRCESVIPCTFFLSLVSTAISKVPTAL